MSIKNDIEYLNDILNSIERIELYIKDIAYSDFIKDLKTQDAVIRNISVIGEAASRLSEKNKQDNSHIPWEKIKGTRNRLIHNYSGVNTDILWHIISDDLPNLYLQIKRIVL